MIPGLRTAKLIREAAVLGYSMGRIHGRTDHAEDFDESGNLKNYPKDSNVLAAVLRQAKSWDDIFPALAKVEWEDTTKWPQKK